MNFISESLRTSKQLFVLLLWVVFIGCAFWWHAQQSQQPPIGDAATYFQKAYNFWVQVHQHKLFNPFNVVQTIRPPGTILMSYPFGFNVDYRGFYFRSIFLPVLLLVLAVVLGGYRRDLDSKSKWHLVLYAAFLSSFPCFYEFELTWDLPSPAYWGLVDNFLAGVAALATAVIIRSVWTQSYAWLSLGVILSSLCLMIKPAGAFVMMLNGLTWFGLTVLNLRLVWRSPDERKRMIRWLLKGMTIFAFFYMVVLVGSFTSHYLSPQNLAFGKTAINILQMEWSLSWAVLLNVIKMGVGYPFVIWLLLMIICVGNHLLRICMDVNAFLWHKPFLIGLAISSCIILAFGIWFWIFGTGVGQIRYSIPFALMAAILALPSVLSTVRATSNWSLSILSVLMIAPIINMGLLLPQSEPSIEWQKWSGVNLTSGAYDPVIEQAQNFVNEIKKDGRDVALYSMPMNLVDADFQSVVDYAQIAKPQIPLISIFRPVDWKRPTAFRKEEMLEADFLLFQPIHDSTASAAIFATSSIDDLNLEIYLFQAWATQLTTSEGVTIVSDSPKARILRITNPNLLESAFDKLVANHHWRRTFIEENPKRRYSEKELKAALLLNLPNLENVNFEERFHLRALSISSTGDNTTLSVWWKPLSPLIERDWTFFIHSIDDENNMVLNNRILIRFNRSLSLLPGEVLFDQITFRNPRENGIDRLAVGFIRPNQKIPFADKGNRDWGNRRVIVPLP